MNKELNFLIDQKVDIKYHLNDEHIFIVNAWIDNPDKEKILVKCIKKLKEFNIPILLVTAGDRPYNLGVCLEIRQEIRELCDYFLFNEKNELLPFEKIKELNINSLRYIQMNDITVHSYVDFHHDYAVLSNLKKAIIFSEKLGKKKIHYLEYDNIIDADQYYQTFLIEINNFDCVLYEYERGSINNNYAAFFIFSMKIELALNFITEIKSLNEHFMSDDWRAEYFLLNRIKRYTNSIKLTNYIDNDKKLNICYLWNRETLKGLLFYIVVDNMKNLFIMLKSDNKVLIEMKYDNYNKFNYINGYQLFNIGKYNIGKVVELKYMGISFFTKTLKDSFEVYKEKNYLLQKFIFNFENLVEKYDLKINGSIVIGAHYGQENSDFVKYNIENKLFFEPLPHVFEILKDKVKDGILVNKAIGNENTKIMMYVERSNDGQSSSILKPINHTIQFPWITFDEKIEVEMIKLDDYLIEDSYNYNYLQIDVQGYELEVLKGSIKTLNYIDYIVVEVNNDEVYENCARIDQLDMFLMDFGFARLETDWRGGLWGDAFYKKTKKLIFDIGANRGLFSDSCKLEYTNSKIILVEPNNNLTNYLTEKYITNNSFIVVNNACSANDGDEIDFFIGVEYFNSDVISTCSTDWMEKSRFSSHHFDEPIKVSTITLNTLILKYGVPDLIKVDVEGFEYEVFRNLTYKINEVCWEWVEEEFDKVLQICQHLCDIGYEKFGYVFGDEYLKKPQKYKNFIDFENELRDFIVPERKEKWGMIWAR